MGEVVIATEGKNRSPGLSGINVKMISVSSFSCRGGDR